MKHVRHFPQQDLQSQHTLLQIHDGTARAGDLREEIREVEPTRPPVGVGGHGCASQCDSITFLLVYTPQLPLPSVWHQSYLQR